MVNSVEQKRNFRILIVDDEPLIRQSLFEILRIQGYRVDMVPSGEEAMEALKRFQADVIVTDLKLPKMDGIELLKRVRRDYQKIEVILITGYGSIESAVEAMKMGAFDYITKPINDSEIQMVINKLLEKKALIKENEELKELVAKGRRSFFGEIVGQSEKMQYVYRMVEAVANSKATILVSGESGTGKGLVARAIHDSDPLRKDKPFVEVSCGALTETLLESELFGHAKGAFTGAIKDKEGRFEYANGGTIFLDEIDAFSLNLQVKLLKVLQDNIFERVGDNVTRKTDARIIVATNQDLTELVKSGKFREDLYYRINVISILMPPLRERRDDIDLLVEHYIKEYNKINKKSIKGISEEVKKIFREYPWPGNIRELQNAIEGAVIMTQTDIINKLDVPNIDKFKSIDVPRNSEKLLKKAVEDPEREHIMAVLNECGWNRNKAAAILGVNRTTLYNKMKKYNIVEQRV